MLEAGPLGLEVGTRLLMGHSSRYGLNVLPQSSSVEALTSTSSECEYFEKGPFMR